MTYCKKVEYDKGRGIIDPGIILGKVETVKEGNTTIKEVTTGKGKVHRIRSDLIFKISDTNELFKKE